MAATTFETELADLKKQGATLLEAVKELNEPQYKAHAGSGAVSYWDTDARPMVLKTRVKGNGQQYDSLPRSLPKGYKNEAFKSAGEFYRDLVKSPEEFSRKHESVRKTIQGASTQTAADGGAWILPEFSQQIIDQVYSNDLWQRTDGYTVAGNNLTFRTNAETSRANGSRHGGLRGYWTAEGVDTTKSKPSTRDVTLKLNKLAVLVYLTDELMEDAGPALEQYVTRKAAEEFEFMLGDALLNGTGVGMPLGILNSPALLAVSAESGQAAATIVAENIDKMWARRIVGGSYAWYHNQDCGPQLDGLAQDVGTGGVVLYRPTDGLAGVAPQSLKGAPRVETEFNATLGTTGDLVLADLGQYLTISKGGISQAVSMHVEFVSAQTALRFTMRVDGRPAWVSPVTPFKGTNTQSYFLSLATR